MPVSNSSIIGANLNGNSDGSTALFAVGSRCGGTNDTEWIYVQANVPLTTGQMVYLNTTYTAQLANVTNTITGNELAFAQGAFNTSDFGWVCKRGSPIYVLVSSLSTVGGNLFVADNSGTLTGAAVSGTMAGIAVITASATGVAVVMQSYVTWPRARVLTGAGAG